MRKKIYTKPFDEKKNKYKELKFALLPKIVDVLHPTHHMKYIIWWEWYQVFDGHGYLLDN